MSSPEDDLEFDWTPSPDEIARRRRGEVKRAREQRWQASQDRSRLEHMSWLGRLFKPIGIALIVLIAIPTIVSCVVMGQYIPLIVLTVVVIVLWMAFSRGWRALSRLIVSMMPYRRRR